jgi:hypothetical protein
MYSKNHDFISISKEDINKNLQNKTFQYISNNNLKIPGLDLIKNKEKTKIKKI